MSDEPDVAAAALWRVLNLAERWEDPIGKTSFEAMIERGYAAELRQVIAGEGK